MRANMDRRRHPRPDSDRLFQVQDQHPRFSQEERDQNYPKPDPGERGRHWGHPDAYPAHFTGPPAGPAQSPYMYGYGWPDYHRPQSRQGYEYSPHSPWDYSYGYYDYYRGQHAQQDGGQWGAQEFWRTRQHHERTHNLQEPAGKLSTEFRSEQRRSSSQHYLADHEDPSRDEDISSFQPGALESSKNSGLSSSSYELSQYMNGAEHGDPHQQPAPTSHGDRGPAQQSSEPLKFSVPHAVVSFGPVGQLVRVTPGMSAQQNIGQLEIHSMEVILSENQEQQEMRNFPGPLARKDLHKVDVIEFAQRKAGACMTDESLQEKSSAALLWNLLILLCRQNGQIVGSDIAELLMQGSRPDGSWQPEAPSLIDFSDDWKAEEAPPPKGDDLLTGDLSSCNSQSLEKALQTYTQLLLAGRKKEALEAAMSSGLWGHALFLASKMGSRSYTTVLNRFTDQLTASDPLQTLFQLLSGRIPTVATCCGNDKWGDWRPHLAVMLSNETGNLAVQQKAIVTMGDSLASRGLTHAAHLCYLTASAPFGVFTQTAERLVLLGSSHRQPFQHFASNSAIQRTELYEYSQKLRAKSFLIPSFQVYKLLYASRLLDLGLPSQAFHYCEVVGEAVLRQSQPCSVLTAELVKLSDRLRYSEDEFSGAGFSGAGSEPEWLKRLRSRHHSFQTVSYDFTETDHPAPVSRDLTCDDRMCPASDLDYLTCDVQNPEPKLLYHGSCEAQENLTNHTCGNHEITTVMCSGESGAKDWPHANSPTMPGTVVEAPPAPTEATSQNASYHNMDSDKIKSAMPNCPLETNVSSEVRTMPEVLPPTVGGSLGVPPVEGSDGTNQPPKQSTKTGWFSGWFRSKAKDVQKKPSETGGPAQSELLPATSLCPPPPPTNRHPGMNLSQTSSPGINPFSRKAGQHLG
ncbi:protein transport protein Sec16B [Melanotaenia boesemani]|uniref:protein transport protein Sec16B n=1 Tax=Melanotaenia boesemani TaxID=1250792 RepID=UPI001C041756|nr:protein transport protein Sec16B [Melanotaenia boesemani]